MIAEFMQAVYRELAPSGSIRAAVHFGNTAIAHRDERTGEPSGTAVELVDQLAHRLGAARQLLTYAGAGEMFQAGLGGEWDLGFLAVDPARARAMDFTLPYLVLEGAFLVRRDSPFRTLPDLDVTSVHVAAVEASFHDLHLTRRLRHARLVRSKTLMDAVAQLLAGSLDAVAGLRPTLAAVAASQVGLRVIDGRYAAVQQAIAIPKGRPAALKYLNSFLEEARTNTRTGIRSAGER